MSESAYAAAQRLLNETATFCSDGKLSYRIHYWGMMWRHYDNPVHRHSFYEVCYVLDGYGEYEDEGRTFELRSGSQFLSLPGHWHQIRSVNGLQLFYVAYEPIGDSAALQVYETAMRCHEEPIILDHENVTALLWRALHRQAEGEPADRIRALAGLLLSSFATVFGPRVQAPAREPSLSRSDSQMVALARRFIRDNLSRPLKLADVASYLHMSDRHLSRMFHKHGGETFGECLARERLSKAETLLKTTVLSIKEIAEETGFQSVHYFTRAFTKHFSMPPAAYRKISMNRSEPL